LGFIDLALVLFAPFVGSFLGVVVTRLPRGETVLTGRSRCDLCARPLGPLDMMPLVSWIARRGRCRCGEARLPALYPLLELAALGVVFWAWTELQGWLLLASCLLGWTLLTLAVIDAREMLLPDSLTLPLIPVGLLAVFAVDPGRLPAHTIAALAGFVLFEVTARLYRRIRGREGLGQGDAKLLAAGGAWVGPFGLPSVILLAALSGLTFTLVRRFAGHRLGATTELPFGPHLALGIWLVWLYGPLRAG
jgi:leader peptidase (prepilin peptidase)/N-methyltransferase